MIKAIARVNRKKVLVLGLSFANLDRFKAEPIDTYILVDGKDLGLNIDVLIMSGETEEEIMSALHLSPDSKIVDMRKTP